MHVLKCEVSDEESLGLTSIVRREFVGVNQMKLFLQR